MAKKSSNSDDSKIKRAYISQSEIPSYSLEQALRVPKAIIDNYASDPSTPLKVAKALDMQPNSSGFKMMCGASIAYGLTNGGYNANVIIVEQLAKRILKPLVENDDLKAKREAFLKPRVIGEFLTKYNGSPIPRPDIAINVLTDMGVPEGKAEEILQMISNGAESLGLVQDIKGKKYIDLESTSVPDINVGTIQNIENDKSESEEIIKLKETQKEVMPRVSLNKKVFITHGKNKSFIEPIKKLLKFGELEPVISVEKQSVSQPVPDKVMNEMRICGAAIIHVDADETLIDKEAVEHVILNPNVLIEIGAAMALFGRRFILLVKEGVKLPSNLQGLFEVRYSNDTLDGDTTIKLLEAINEMKNQPFPTNV